MITDISNPECDIKECLYVFYNWARNTYDNNLDLQTKELIRVASINNLEEQTE